MKPNLVFLRLLCLSYFVIASKRITKLDKFLTTESSIAKKLPEEFDSNWPDEQKIIFKMLDGYDSAARPVYNASHQILINFTLSLIQLSDMVRRI